MARSRRVLAPYLLIMPGGLWLLLFFVVPMVTMLSLSLQQGDIVSGYVFTGHWQTYVDAVVNYRTQLVRSLSYGAITWAAGGNQRVAILATAAFFVGGLLLLLPIRMQRGRDAALSTPQGVRSAFGTR